ncbi:inositol monophosphatase family protein [Pseudobacteroides cellulosolvens]|uniref:Inositol monophosphatase n=1 Tax=Pseudobacteroides cellulosolvens ATCC 35603 = DSM 2933 TaxID=398512 RepID=A0A0L6JJ55_9FIRM|nr:inositol monophosphatase [Pseudobacteroides cellulosolvens]KNY25477.1 inositol monophosphatase [Pseudobacteroides cellulosolvens ATCC 35603 = DSM 2933]
MENIKNIILNAGEVLKKQYNGLKTCETKEKFDLVTQSDYLIEKILINEIKLIYPDYSIYSEEVGSISNKPDKCWIIDPIDGTANFVFGVPYFCISVCLENQGEITEAYVYNPVSEEFFYSTKDEGKSFLDGKEINVSQNNEIGDCLAVFGFSANYNNIQRYYKDWSCIFENAKKGMPLLSPALNICNVARGRTDFFIDLSSNMEGHSAAALILKNAGGKVYNYDFTEWDYKSKGIIVTNGKVCLEQYKDKYSS